MIGYIIFIIVLVILLGNLDKFYKKEKKVYDIFSSLENKANIKILCIVDTSYKFYLFSWLSKYIVDINSEERHGNFSKRLHKLSGHLFLIINFNNLDQQKTQQIIKALSAYSNLSGNTLTTYVPYKTKESSTLIALTGKNIVVGNYSTITITKVNDALSKLLKVYY